MLLYFLDDKPDLLVLHMANVNLIWRKGNFALCACVMLQELHCILLRCNHGQCQSGGRPASKAYIIRRQCIRSCTDKLLHEIHSSPPEHQAAYRLRGLVVLIPADNVL